MGQIVRVKCNGPNQCVNDVDLDKATETTTVVRSYDPSRSRSEIPARVVYQCRHCTEGKVILTRQMIEEMQKHRA